MAHKKGGDLITTAERMAAYTEYSRFRDSKGMTDYAVSHATGVPTATLSNWKAGNYMPKIDKLSKIAACVGADVGDILAPKGGDS